MNKLLNIRYGALCQELGGLYCNKKKIEERIRQIESEIDGLDSLAAIYKNNELHKNVTSLQDEKDKK